MADIVLAVGTSHSPMLNSTAAEQRFHAEVDRGMESWPRQLVDREGNKCSFDALLQKAPPGLADQITDAVMARRVAECQTCLDRLEEEIADARLDALIVIGDDQKEQFLDDNMPAILVYTGETIPNTVSDLPADAPEFWRKARAMYHEESGTRDYPVAADLARHLVAHLMAADFDLSHSSRLPRARGEGHAFGFVHRRLMRSRPTPIVPVALNTYFPPNQPRPERCHQLGRAIRSAVADYPGNGRVGVLASGGLSHFTIDEELDRAVLRALEAGDHGDLRAIPEHKLRAGNSEIRNWIAMAGAAEDLAPRWLEYVPCYRSLAGTGCAMGFAVLAAA